eukprot:GEMP01015787.1.p1 GENE.GEMP01015787.1~~GEMP01015787.1.p1  ORF type:complete len:788 (-),score=145.49 GEMP01015787.1:470-2833(-)
MSPLLLRFAPTAFWAFRTGLELCPMNACDDLEGSLRAYAYAANCFLLALRNEKGSELYEGMELFAFTIDEYVAMSGLHVEQIKQQIPVVVESVNYFLEREAEILQNEKLLEVSASESGGEAESIVQEWTLSNGVKMPMVGYGTWKLNGTSCMEALSNALKSGVRHFDTAQNYDNAACLRSVIQSTNRSEIFITHKVSHFEDYHSHRLRNLVARQLKALGTTYIDLYLIHRFPHHEPELFFSAWKELEVLYDTGVIRALGISNFDKRTIDYVFGHPIMRVLPHVIQNKFSIYQPGEWKASRVDMLAIARNWSMAFVGYSPLNAEQGFPLSPLKDPLVLDLARAAGEEPAALLLKYNLHRGVGVIPKSLKIEKIRKNAPDNLIRGLQPAVLAVLDSVITLCYSIIGGHGTFSPSWARDGLKLKSSMQVPIDVDKAFEKAERVLSWDWDAIHPEAKVAIEFIQKLPSVRLAHSKDMMFNHLIGVFSTLHLWNQPKHICLFGLYHSVYGATGAFQFKLLNATDENRLMVQRLIGTDAEGLVHTYSRMDYAHFISHILHYSHIPSSSLSVPAWRSNEPDLWMSNEDAIATIIVGLADGMDQTHEVNGWANHLTDMPKLWPQTGRPQPMVSSISNHCSSIRSTVGQLNSSALALPPVLDSCLNILHEADEVRATDMYWNMTHHGWDAEKLRAVVALNPYIGEPEVVLAQIAIRGRDFTQALTHAAEGRRKILALGTAWDKRYTYGNWLFLANNLMLRARRGVAKLRHQVGPRDGDGMVDIARFLAGSLDDSAF